MNELRGEELTVEWMRREVKIVLSKWMRREVKTYICKQMNEKRGVKCHHLVAEGGLLCVELLYFVLLYFKGCTLSNLYNFII